MQEQLIDSNLSAGDAPSPANPTDAPIAPPRKLRGGHRAGLSRFKALWRKLPEDQRAAWRDLFASPLTRAEIRAELLAKLNVHFHHDSQINDVRAWELEQRQLDLQSQRQREDQRRALQQLPHWSLPAARELLLRQAYQCACVHGDFKLGLAAMKQDLSGEALAFSRAKHLDSRRSRLQTGLAELSKRVQDNPEALKLYETLNTRLQAPPKPTVTISEET